MFRVAGSTAFTPGGQTVPQEKAVVTMRIGSTISGLSLPEEEGSAGSGTKDDKDPKNLPVQVAQEPARDASWASVDYTGRVASDEGDNRLGPLMESIDEEEIRPWTRQEIARLFALPDRRAMKTTSLVAQNAAYLPIFGGFITLIP
jgi:hypothetical protein